MSDLHAHDVPIQCRRQPFPPPPPPSTTITTMSLLTFTRSVARSAAAPRILLSSAASLSSRAKHTLPELDYSYDVSVPHLRILTHTNPSSSQALEPHISGQIMKLHHTKHHQTYVNGLNAAEENYAKTQSPKERIALQAALKFNGGGTSHLNNLTSGITPHRRLAQQVTSTTPSSGRTSLPSLRAEANSPADLSRLPSRQTLVASKVCAHISAHFAQLLTHPCIAAFKKTMNEKTAALQGSGWGWLGYNPSSKKLEIVTTPNQDPLLCTFSMWFYPSLLGSWNHTFLQRTSPSSASTSGNT